MSQNVACLAEVAKMMVHLLYMKNSIWTVWVEPSGCLSLCKKAHNDDIFAVNKALIPSSVLCFLKKPISLSRAVAIISLEKECFFPATCGPTRNMNTRSSWKFTNHEKVKPGLSLSALL